MPRILRSSQSREDYRSIYDYVSNDSPQNAEMLIRLFDQKLELLASHNTMGRVRPDLAPNLRCWLVHRFILFYRPIEDGIILVRVLHSSMDISGKHFRLPPRQ
jgi:toxin ParE1/3/4